MRYWEYTLRKICSEPAALHTLSVGFLLGPDLSIHLLPAAAGVLTRGRDINTEPLPNVPHRIYHWDMAASTGIEPAISSATDWRALRCSTKLYNTKG